LRASPDLGRVANVRPAHGAITDMSDSTDRSSPARARSAAGTERVFVDAEGTRWHVSERPFADYDRRSGLSLIFASESAVRRVRVYPENWPSLSDVDLLALSWRA